MVSHFVYKHYSGGLKGERLHYLLRYILSDIVSCYVLGTLGSIKMHKEHVFRFHGKKIQQQSDTHLHATLSDSFLPAHAVNLPGPCSED